MKNKLGFSLMEMMVVLLITAVVAAATAPMINRKMMHNQAELGSPWIYVGGADNSIAYNLKNANGLTASIGAVTPDINDEFKRPRLYIKSKKNVPHITFDDGTTKTAMRMSERSIIITDSDSLVTNDDEQLPERAVAIVPNPPYDTTINPHSVAIGSGARANQYALALGEGADAIAEGSMAIGPAYKHTVFNGITRTSYIGPSASSDYSIAIGYATSAGYNGSSTIAIGNRAKANTSNSISIGSYATAGNFIGDDVANNIAIGNSSKAENGSIAIGSKNGESTDLAMKATGTNSIAIGNNAQATHANSVAIGAGATTAADNQIVLGTNANTVYIPGNLVVGGDTYLGVNSSTNAHNVAGVYVKYQNNIKGLQYQYNGLHPAFTPQNWAPASYPTQSDRRLKNVGKAFTGGLEEIKKLEVFNYTFKKDANKTLRVGVMAQDLEKIFPNAVMKGDDGFLRIRMEDMFYSLVNAVKELDKKLDLLEQKQKRIDELEARLDKLEKRLEKLEKQEKKSK